LEEFADQVGCEPSGAPGDPG